MASPKTAGCGAPVTAPPFFFCVRAVRRRPASPSRSEGEAESPHPWGGDIETQHPRADCAAATKERAQNVNNCKAVDSAFAPCTARVCT